MGLRYRKSKKIGPVRVNVSKSGIGYSVGTKGARYTHKANGGTRTTVSIPGTGVGYVQDSSGNRAAKQRSGFRVWRFLGWCLVIMVLFGVICRFLAG